MELYEMVLLQRKCAYVYLWNISETPIIYQGLWKKNWKCNSKQENIIFCFHNRFYKNSFKSSPEDMFIDFRERGREREKHWCEKETLIGCLPYTPQPKSNPQPFSLRVDSPTNWATQPGLMFLLSLLKGRYQGDVLLLRLGNTTCDIHTIPSLELK